MSRSYRFGEFLVNPASRELWRGQRLVALPPPVFDCLSYLLEHHDRAVGRDELVAAVWGKTQISDTLLGQTILRIRRELRDDGKEQRVLRTIPRFGYRWVAPFETEDASIVTPAAPASPADPALTLAAEPATRTEPPAPRTDTAAADTLAVDLAAGATAPTAVRPMQSSRRGLLAAMVFGALLLVSAGAWLLHRMSSAPDTAAVSARAGAPVSAVLPASIEPASAEWSWMRLGVMDATAARLRSAGLASVPSENVVALLAAPEGRRSSDLRATLAAELLITPHVLRIADSWHIELAAEDGAGRHYAAEAQASDAMMAARAAADRLLAILGRDPVQTGNEHVDSALVRRIDAALLADDPASARALIAQASPDEQQSAEVRLRLAKMDFRGGRLDEARARLVAMLDEAPANTAPILRASILNGLGAVAIAQAQPQQADLHFSQAIELLEKHSDPEQLGQAWLGRAAAAADQRQFDIAATYYPRARIAYRQANDTLALIRVFANEGFAEYDLGRPARALHQLMKASEGFEKWGALNEALLTYIGQISCNLALLDNRMAMQAADAGEALAARVDNPHTLERYRVARGRALIATGRLREARQLLDEVIRGAVDRDTAAVAEVALARLALESGDGAEAARQASHAISVLTAVNHLVARADAWLIQLRAELRAGDKVQATKTLNALEDWAKPTDEAQAHLVARVGRAEYAHQFSEGDWRRQFDEARDLAAHGDMPRQIALVAVSYVEALLSAGDLDAATIETGRVSRWSEQDFSCALLEARLYAATGHEEARRTAIASAELLAGERPIPAALRSATLSSDSAKP